MRGPVDQDYDQAPPAAACGDGRRRPSATLTLYRAEQVTAWTRIDTTGTIHSVAVVGDDVYLLVQRPEGFSTRWNIERLDDALHLDAGLMARAKRRSPSGPGWII